MNHQPLELQQKHLWLQVFNKKALHSHNRSYSNTELRAKKTLFLNLWEHSISSKLHRTFFFCACSFSEALEGLRLNIFTVSGPKISPVRKRWECYTSLGQLRFLSQSELSALKKYMLRGRHSCTHLQQKPRKSRGLTETKMVQTQTNEVCVCMPGSYWLCEHQLKKKKKRSHIQFCVVVLLLTVDDQERWQRACHFHADVWKGVNLMLFQFSHKWLTRSPPPSVESFPEECRAAVRDQLTLTAHILYVVSNPPQSAPHFFQGHLEPNTPDALNPKS